MAACVLVEAMIPRRDEITNPKSRICPNCSSPEQNSNFCTDCGAEVVPAVPVFDKIVSLLFRTIAGLIGIAIGIAAIILVLLLTVVPSNYLTLKIYVFRYTTVFDTITEN